MEIVTGSTGRTHVTPIDDAVRNSHLALITERVVYSVPNYESFRAQDVTANEVRVYSGYGSNQGRIFKIDENDFDSVTIENGSVNTKRMDLIVARYTMNQQSGNEDISLAVIKGTTGADYTEPEHETGNINSGAIIDDFVLYKVYIDGIAIDHLEKMFEPLPDGGFIGVVKALMDTINNKIDLIPFDLDEAVNKTYVDNKADTITQALRANFQNGVDTIKDAIDTYVTPTASTPRALAAAVDDVYNKGYGDAVESRKNVFYYRLEDEYGSSTNHQEKAKFEVAIDTDNLKKVKLLYKELDGDCTGTKIAFKCMESDGNGNTTMRYRSWNIVSAAVDSEFIVPNETIGADLYINADIKAYIGIEYTYHV